jgi:hypothetical protein
MKNWVWIVEIKYEDEQWTPAYLGMKLRKKDALLLAQEIKMEHWLRPVRVRKYVCLT